MKRQVLEIDKMQHLNELGVDINKASMCWIREQIQTNITRCLTMNFVMKCPVWLR